MKKNYFLVMALVCLNTFASTIYVNKNATGSNNGTSWTNAYTTMELAFSNSIVGDQVWVAAGVYKPAGTSRSTAYNIPNGVAVYGSFAGTETALLQRDLSGGATTTLNGDINAVGVATDNCYSVVKFTNVSNLTIFDGFKIINGYNNSSTSGGAIFNSGGQPTIRNCELIANYAARGGAFGNSTSGVTTLIGCKIRNNSATEGGGIQNGSGILKLIGCDISDNTASYGGGMNVEFDNVIIDRTIFSGNSASNTGGAIYLDNAESSTEIYNSLFSGNFANEESVLGMNSAFSNGYVSKVVNCTIVNNRNTSTDPNSSWTVTLPYTSAIFHNNIMSNNTTGRLLLNGTVVNCIIDGAYLPSTSSNVTTTAPTYVAAYIPAAAPFAHDNYNFRLATGSAGINGGSNSLVNPLYNLDLAGNPRTSDGIVDIGAYENTALATGEFGPQTALSFYPNPTEGKIFVNVFDQDLEYAIFNLTGAMLQKGKLTVANQAIDMAGFTSGMYFVALSNGATHKIIKK
jgi:predicted outer membrane repeat protein